MTDEEITDKYAEKVVKHKMAVHDIFNEKVTKKEIKEAVMYGLKAGRPVWHKVADGDLPKETRNYLTYSEEWGVEIRKFFVDVGYFECRKDIVIAWKEIVLPKE